MIRPGQPPPRRDSRTGERGNAMLEFAVGFSVLWLLFSGVFAFGYTLYVYNALQTAVRNAATLASRSDFDSTGGGAAFVARAKNMAVYGSPGGGSAVLVPKLTPANVSITWVADSAGVPKTITVAITGYTIDAVFRSFTFNNKPSLTVSYAGSFKI